MPPSTDAAAPSPVRCPHAWPIDQIAIDVLADGLGTSRAEAKQRKAEVARTGRDAAAIDRMLDELPVPCLAILSVLAEHGGMCTKLQLEDELRERFGLEGEEIRTALGVAQRALALVVLTSQWGDRALAMVSPAAELIAPRVRDLDIPELPADGFVAETGDRSRMLLAAVTMLDHASVRPNADGRPNKSQLKRLAAQAGIEVGSLAGLLEHAASAGLLCREDEQLRPDRAALEAAARGRYPQRPMLQAMADRIARGPIAWRAVERIHRQTYARSHDYPHLPGFARGMVGDIPALGRVDLGGTPAGHVTPSFDVLVPPESPASDLVAIGAFAEVTRIDRVISYRITRTSVARATTGGRSSDDILAALRAVGRHPVPQNVEVAIRDWVGQSQHARITHGYVLVMQAEVADRAEPILRPAGGHRVAPTVIVVDDKRPRRQIEQLLTKAGIQPTAAAEPSEDTRRSSRSGATVALPSLGTPTPRLRDRCSAWLRDKATSHPADLAFEKTADLDRMVAQIEMRVDRWAAQAGIRWRAGDDHREALILTLTLLGPDAAGIMLERDPDPAQLASAALTVLSELPRSGRTPLPVPIDQLRSRLRPLLVSAVRPPTPVAAAPMAKVAGGLAQYLRRAADDERPVELRLRDGRETRLHIDEVSAHGSTTMVLGEDDDGVAVAIRLDEIAALLGDTSGESTPPSRWVPGPGAVAPAGHHPCPCGSGLRYRTCCRRTS